MGRFVTLRWFLYAPAWMVLIVTLSCTGGHTQQQSDPGDAFMTDKQLEGLVTAPEFPTHLQWVNTDHPLTLKQLRGKVVLLDFWTFCCINCMHVLPDLRKLEEKYNDELVVIGVHSAKFANEQDTEQIRQAILRYEIAHPVVNDYRFEIWNSYGARAWPTLVLINPNGRIIGSHSGEGVFDAFDGIIARAVEYFDRKGELKRSAMEPLSVGEGTEPTALLFPGKVKADTRGKRLFISDSNHNRIIVADRTGAVADVIGSGSNGSGDGTFEEAAFFHPQGTCLVGDILYIADTENHLIRAADLKKRTVRTVLGTGKQARRSNVGGIATGVALNSPWDLVAHDGKLFIAMAGPHQIWVADLHTMEAAPHAGSGREDRLDGPLPDAALAQPSGITTDGTKLYFADSEVSSIRSASIAPDGTVETIIGHALFEFGDVDGGWEEARLQHPLGVVYKDGLLYVADTYNARVKVVDPETRTSTTYAGTGEHGLTDGPADEARFNEPSGITTLDDELFIADANNHQIRVLNMESRQVRTLVLTGLERFERPSSPRFAGRIVRLAPHRLRAGSAEITVDVNLPGGCKLAPGAPTLLHWQSSDEDVVQFARNDGETISFPFSLPARTASGTSDLTLEAVVYYCQGESSVCLLDNVRILVPVTVDTDGPSRLSVSLEVQRAET
ncbi:MAG TPA: thioredoxin-like domain-containing protein [Acidobacteriota bacterium]|nr:thioredoxin-like domain-containing protein [Acidobacteriota bacterium]